MRNYVSLAIFGIVFLVLFSIGMAGVIIGQTRTPPIVPTEPQAWAIAVCFPAGFFNLFGYAILKDSDKIDEGVEA